VLAVLVATAAARTTPRSPPEDALRRVFLVLAVAFLIGPLGFPWYFTWCVPLLPFVRARSWLLLPGLLSLYYLRFWFDYQFPGGLAGFESGVAFFDEVVAPVEFGVLYAVLLLGGVWGRRSRERGPSADPTA
jgi:hypothetical protein